MIEFIYKVVFDISCYFSCASFLLNYGFGYETNPMSFMILILSALACGFVEYHKTAKWGRFIVVFIPTMAFLWETTLLGSIEFVLPWAYLIWHSFSEYYHIGYNRFKKMFRRTLLLYIIPLAILIAFADNVTGVLALGASVPYLICYLSMGVMLLQLLRHQSGTTDKKIFEKYQIKQAITFFVCSFLLTVCRLAEIIGNFIYNFLIKPFAAAIFGIMSYTSYVVDSMNDTKGQNKIQNFGEYVQSQKFDASSESFIQEMEAYQKANKEPVEHVPMEVTVILLVFCVGVVILLFFVLKGNQKKKVRELIIEDEREEITQIATPEKKLKKHFVSPKIQVRYYYRIFMKKAQTEEYKIRKSDTTEDISNKYKRHNAGKSVDEQTIKLIYRRARYSEDEITKEDVATMKKLVKKA